MKSMLDQMENLTGLSIYPLISLLIFFSFFAVMVLWVVFMNQSMIQKMKNLPLEEN